MNIIIKVKDTRDRLFNDKDKKPRLKGRKPALNFYKRVVHPYLLYLDRHIKYRSKNFLDYTYNGKFNDPLNSSRVLAMMFDEDYENFVEDYHLDWDLYKKLFSN